MVHNLSYHPGLGDSDHCCLKFDLTCYAIQTSKDVQLPNYYRANYESIRSRITLLNSTFVEDYTKFIEQNDFAPTGNLPMRVSSKKKKHKDYKTTTLETISVPKAIMITYIL